MDDPDTLGSDIRALRSARKMTLTEMAEQLGKSVGWVSQVERGLSTPTVSDLHAFARVLDTPMSMFFGAPKGPEDERGLVVRACGRREIGERDNGLVEALLSPDLTDDFEVIHSTFLPGAELDTPRQRATTEVVTMIAGTLNIWIGDTEFTVQTGDSFRIKGSEYRWANPYNTPAQAIWVISPPVY